MFITSSLRPLSAVFITALSAGPAGLIRWGSGSTPITQHAWSNIGPHCAACKIHYIDVIMTTMGSQITSLTVVYSTVYSDADQRKHQSSASLAFVWGIQWDRWIPRTKGQLRGKYFHLMTSSWYCRPVRCWWGAHRSINGVNIANCALYCLLRLAIALWRKHLHDTLFDVRFKPWYLTIFYEFDFSIICFCILFIT